MRIIFHPSLQRLRLAWNIIEIWRALQAEEAPAPPSALPSPVDWLIWRQGLAPHYRSLDAVETQAIGALLAGQTFGDLCEGLAEGMDIEPVGPRAASLLKGWVTEGLVTAIRLGPSRSA